jgi:hypothetical protein
MTDPFAPPPAAPEPVDEQVDYDFDAAWAERRAKAPRVRILGKVYRLPSTPPAKIILFLSRNQAHPTREIRPDELLELLGTLLGGNANMQTLLSDGLEMDQLSDVMQYCMNSYKTAKEEAGGQGEAPAPTTGQETTPSA